MGSFVQTLFAVKAVLSPTGRGPRLRIPPRRFAVARPRGGLWPAIAALLLVTSAVEGQENRARKADPEAEAGAKLTAYLKSEGMRVTNTSTAQAAFVEKYCSDCHNSTDVAGSLDL